MTYGTKEDGLNGQITFRKRSLGFRSTLKGKADHRGNVKTDDRVVAGR